MTQLEEMRQLEKIQALKKEGYTLNQAMNIIRGETSSPTHQGPHCPLPKGGRTVEEILREYNTYGVVSLSPKEKELLVDFHVEYDTEYLGHYDGTIYVCNHIEDKPSPEEESLRQYEDYEDKY